MITKNYNKIIKITRQRGVSLIELMISIFIGLIVLAGVIEVVVSSGDSYRVQDAMMQMQKNGQFAIELMTQDLRNTDFWGCIARLDNVTNLLNASADPFFDFSSAVDGTADGSASGVVAGTDTITVRGVTSINDGQLQSAAAVETAALTVGSTTGINVGDVALVSDCTSGNLFQTTGVSGNTISHAVGGSLPGNSTASLTKIFGTEATVYRAFARTYSVRSDSNGIPTLFLSDSSGNQELVQGVESLVILFGEDTDGDQVANRYVRANNVEDMNNVVSIRVNLLLQTVDDHMANSNIEYTFNDEAVTPTDHRLRRVYVSTIMLRNRGS